MIVLFFGATGRVGQLCNSALRLARPMDLVYMVNRNQEFVCDSVRHASIHSLLTAHPHEKVIWIDASVDHSSIANLIAHEAFKRHLLFTVNQRGVLDRAIGLSSGVTLISRENIRSDALHMREYQRQKKEQECLFSALSCATLLPNLFTLVGPFTYRAQAAAWAHILKSRIESRPNVVIDEPHARKAWVSEFQLFNVVLDFLCDASPSDYMGPLVSGHFSLAEIASAPRIPWPPLEYMQGQGLGWLIGDYLPNLRLAPDCESIDEELLRSIFTKV